MNLSTRLAAILLACLAEASGSVCPVLEPGQNARFLLSSGPAPCFLVNVGEGQAARVSFTQPVDLALRLSVRNTTFAIDGFDFGLETATMDLAGQYRIDVSPVSDTRITPVTVVMSSESLPLQKVKEFREAENLAFVSKQSGRVADIMKSLQAWEAINDISGVARTWLKKGDAELGAGELSAAHDAYEKALSFCDSISDVRCAAEAENNSGWVSERLGDFDASLDRLTSAARDWRKLGDRKSEGQTLSNLGLLYWQSSDYQNAIGLYEKAERILAPLDRLAHARVLNNLGLCYQALAEYEKARGYFNRAIASETNLPSGTKDALVARLNLGRNYLRQGQPGVARRVLDRDLSDATRLADRVGIANALNNLGQVLLALHLPSEARPRLEQALEIHRTLGDKGFTASDLHYLGVAAAASGQAESARSSFIHAIQIRRTSLLRDAAADSLFALADLERSERNLAAARDYAEQALTLLESIRLDIPGAALRASFYSQKRRFFDLLLETVIVPGNSDAAEDGLLISERGRGRALLDLLAEGSVPELLPADLLKRRSDIQRRIDLVSARLAVAAGDRERALRDQVELLVAEDEEIEAAYRENLAAQPLGQPLDSVQKLQREFLPSDAALLEFHLGDRGSYLWLVTREKLKVFPLPPRAVVESQVRTAVELYRAVLDRKRSPEKQAAFRLALRTVSGTLLSQLPESALSGRLIVVPDGSLFRLPFAALRFPGSGRTLGLDFDLVEIPTAAYLGAGRQPRRISEFPRSLLAVVDPVFSSGDPRVASAPVKQSPRNGADGAGLARLPFASELDAAALLIPPARLRVLRGFTASPSHLRQSALKDFAVLHFSTHAAIDDRIPELSRIALSLVDRSGKPTDGFLRPYQLSEFHLDGSTVVLSACDTALGKEILGEGLAGFSASLLHAGAAQIVMTLAEVDAEASSEFLKQTYHAYFSPGDRSMDHSLTLARRSLSKSARWSDPYYWASFVLYGAPQGSRPAAVSSLPYN